MRKFHIFRDFESLFDGEHDDARFRFGHTRPKASGRVAVVEGDATAHRLNVEEQNGACVWSVSQVADFAQEGNRRIAAWSLLENERRQAGYPSVGVESDSIIHAHY